MEMTLKELIEQTDAEFAKLVPEWRGKGLSGKQDEKALREAWNGLFQKNAFSAVGRVRDRVFADAAKFNTGA